MEDPNNPLTKDSNPKSAFGDRKPPTSVIPQTVIYELGLAMLEGALKYGRHNYRTEGVRMSTYYDACRRHLDAWWEGEDIDPDSGVHHLVKAIACLTVCRDAMILDKCTDDRPPRPPADWLKTIADQAAALKERYPDPKAPHVHQDGNN